MSLRFLFRLAAGLLPALLFCLSPARADITLGADARAVGMGGAGLASGLVDAGANPATLADTGPRFAIEMPTVNTRLDGMSYGDVLKLLGDPTLSAGDAFNLAKNLSDGTPRLEASVSAGLLLPQADLRAQATLRAEVQANDAYRILLGGGAADPAAKADVYAGGLTVLPGIGMGMHLPVTAEKGALSVGVRLKPTRAYYSHYVIDGAALAAGAPQLAPEMGGRDYVSATSFSMDAGLLYTPAKLPARLALVVNNLIEPKAINFGANAPAGLANVQLAPRTLSLGAALENNNITLAADLVDVTGAVGKMQLRLGSEVRVAGALALRGGYNSATGFTAGLGLGGFGFAYSQRAPVMLSHSVTF
jgi:hypothetical protein